VKTGWRLVRCNIDTTAAVVGAGTIHGEIAQQVASVIKMSQNVLIGVAAFALALYSTMVVERKSKDERPSAAVIWHRFPKLVLGFTLVFIFTRFHFCLGLSFQQRSDWDDEQGIPQIVLRPGLLLHRS